MKYSGAIFLDEIRDARHIEHFLTASEKIYVANTLAGLEAYQSRAVSDPGALCIWIKSLEELNVLLKPGLHLGAQFLFSYGGLSPSQISNLGNFPCLKSLELPDPRIKDLSLFNTRPQLMQQATLENPTASVIIPIFDNQERAMKALSSWLAQKHSAYEIILVDDGSREPWLSALVGQHKDKLSLIQLARLKERRRGDHGFRAGLARNAGFQWARGGKIVFSDSDIVVSAETLNELESHLQNHDVVMPQRWQLNEPSSRNFVNYEKIDFNSDVVLSPGAFWESFQSEKRSWADHPQPWRWTSTFLLAVHKNTLEQAGVFKKSFVTYGFEDTELGYRLHKMGQRFYLAPLKTYHLHQADSQSEYKNDLRKKKQLLRISADRFFRHHPTKEVYDTLKAWLD